MKAVVAIALLLAAPAARAFEWSGFVAFEGRSFLEGEGLAGQESTTGSVAFEPELYHEWQDGDQSFRLTLFGRWDARDPERSHADVRELYWQKAARRWELAVGLRKVFWGVTESVHLVDVINQTDLVEDPDGEAKLGQPMVQLRLLRSWGTLDLYLLPFFRERTFAGEDGRLRPLLPIDTRQTKYESSQDEEHLDWALRWSRSVGPLDVGVAHFRGTGREPRLLPGIDAQGRPVLAPSYEQIEQTSLDLQATLGPWLWKLEALDRRDRLDHFNAAVGGFEYTFFDVARSGIDVGVLAEYTDDTRAERPRGLFVGSRLGFNDAQSTELLLGGLIGLETEGTFLNLEGARRIGQRWKVELRLRAFLGVAPEDPFFSFRRDDYLQLQVVRYF